MRNRLASQSPILLEAQAPHSLLQASSHRVAHLVEFPHVLLHFRTHARKAYTMNLNSHLTGQSGVNSKFIAKAHGHMPLNLHSALVGEALGSLGREGKGGRA